MLSKNFTKYFLFLLILGLREICLAASVDLNLSAEFSASLEKETNEGWLAYQKGQVTTAQKLFTKALTKNPQSTFAHFGLSTVYSSRGKYQKALTESVAAIEFSKDNPWLEFFLKDALDLLEYAPAEKLLKVLRKKLNKPQITPLRQIILRHTLIQALDKSGRQKAALQEAGKINFIRNWLVLGPFNNRDKSGFKQEQNPEKILPVILPKQKYQGRNRALSWFPVKSLPASGYLNLQAILYPHEENVSFAMTKIVSPIEANISIIIGTAGAVKVWVNETLKWQWNNYNTYHPLQRILPLKLRQGVTQLVFKLAGERGGKNGLSVIILPYAYKDLNNIPSFALSQYTIDLEAKLPKATKSKSVPDRQSGLDWGAMRFLNSRLKNLPPTPLTLAYQGYLLLTRGLNDKYHSQTRRLFEKASALAPACTLFLELSAIMQKDSNEAVKLLRKALKINPDEIAAQELLARYLGRGGLLRESETFCKAILKKQSSASAYSELASIYKQLVWLPEAYTNARQAVKFAPFKADNYLFLAEIELGKQNSINVLQSGIDKTGSHNLRRKLAQVLLQLEFADCQKIKKLLTANLVKNPYAIADYLLLVKLLLRDKKTDNALQLLLEAQTRLPQSPLLLEELGHLQLRLGKKEQAMQNWRQALVISPDNPELRKYLEELIPQQKNFYAAYEKNLDNIISKRPQATDYPRHNAVVLLDQGIVKVNANGTSDSMIHMVRMALRPRGAQRLSRYSLGYDPARERIELLSARVIQEDGSSIAAQQVQATEGKSGKGQGGIYDRYHALTLNFPQVKPGSITELKYISKATAQNVYTDKFESSFYFGGSEPTINFDYVLNSPISLQVKVKTFKEQKIKAKYKEEKKLDRIIRHWSAKNIPGIEIEPLMPPFTEIAPGLRASSFATWQDVGKWYWELSRESLKLPEDIKREVKKLIKNKPAPEAKLAAIYYQIIDKIRYIGIELGRNGYMPHQAERTYRTNYGDCKDTAVLFCSMLKVAGIEARVALVRTWNLGKEPTGMPGARRFNHAICYVPDLGGKEYWLDGTTDYFHFSELPSMDQGALALLTGPGKNKLVTITEKSAASNCSELAYNINLKPDGSGVVKARFNFRGAYAPTYRRVFAEPERFKKLLTLFIKSRFPGAMLKNFKTSGSDLKKKETWFSFSMTVPELSLTCSEGRKIKPWLLPSPLSGLTQQSERKHDLMLSFKQLRIVNATITLPEKSEIISLPRTVEIEHSFAKVSSKALVTNNIIKLKLERKLKTRRIKQADYQKFRTFSHASDSLEEEWIIYK